VAVVGGGPSGVSVAVNLKRRRPDQEVHLLHRGPELLPAYPPPVRAALADELRARGVALHLGRAVLPPAERPDGPAPGPVAFADGGPPLPADAVVWTTGGARPNADFLPAAWRDADGFVRVDERLEVPGAPGVFAVGDVAATDPQRSSARNGGHAVVAANARARLRGSAPRRRFRPPPAWRWGSILGLQPEGMDVHLPSGRRLRFGPWLARTFLFQLVVRWLLFRGIDGLRVRPPGGP
jgi:NADH dehydrogenase FAD-containing subunit